MTSSERHFEEQLVQRLSDLKFCPRADIRDRAALELNFREKFQALNHVKLTDGEFRRLLDEIVTPDVYTAAKTLRGINSFTRDDGTPIERYARRVEMKEIEANAFSLNISRYVSISQDEVEIDLNATHAQLVSAERDILAAAAAHNVFLKELGLPPLPIVNTE